jgi:hypothetical protein
VVHDDLLFRKEVASGETPSSTVLPVGPSYSFCSYADTSTVEQGHIGGGGI